MCASAQLAAINSRRIDYPAFLENAWQAHLAPREADSPTVVSLFAGCGGSSLGYSMAGFRELGAVEWADGAASIFRLNFPHVPLFHGDIKQLSGQQLLDMTGLKPKGLAVLDGSPPCTGFSTAGRRIQSDPRNQLYKEYVRLLRVLQPKVFVMENVKGMVTGRMRVIFDDILRELKDSGYSVSAKLLNAMYFGVPQSRWRLIFIGVRDDIKIAPTHPKPQTRPITIAEAIGHLGNDQIPEIGHCWTDESPTGRNTRTWHLAHRARQGSKYKGHQHRARWNAPSPTLTTGGIKQPYLRGLPCHPLYTRTFSPREMARLTGWTDFWKWSGEPFEWIRPIGNCVPPLFMKAIAEHIRKNILSRIE